MVSTERYDGSHAFLVVKDQKIKKSGNTDFTIPGVISDILAGYSGRSEYEMVPYYTESDIADGLIIDITADQFTEYDEPVYVDYMDPFHPVWHKTPIESRSGTLWNIIIS